MAIDLIERAIELASERNSDCVFPGRNDPNVAMRGPSMNWAYNTILWALGIEDGTIHDLRRTGSTLMTGERLGISPFIRSKVLAHDDTGGQPLGGQIDLRDIRAAAQAPPSRPSGIKVMVPWAWINPADRWRWRR